MVSLFPGFYSPPAFLNVKKSTRFGHEAEVRRHYQKLETQFNTLVSEAKRNPVSDDTIQPDWIAKLQKQARSADWGKTVGDFVMENHPEDMQFLRDQYEKRTLLLEKQEAPPVAGGDYAVLNNSFADLEARTSGMNAASQAVFVGSGPQPNSVRSYANYAGAVKGLDINPDAIEATRALAEQSDGKMSFILQNGNDFDYGPYSHVGIAVMVPDKKRVLDQIDKTAAPGTTVIVRGVDGLKNAMYDGKITPDQYPGFEKMATIHGTDRNITHALLLRKKPLNVLG